jgi:predicted lipoprotein with Yx(FWY)xxD motif
MRRSWRLATVGLLAGLLFLTACGSSSKKASTSATTSTTDSYGSYGSASNSSTSTSTAAASGSALVTTKDDAKLGRILADDHGLTLYTLTAGGKAVPCTGPCAAAWPPLLSASGQQQTSKDGLPLYRFSRDQAPGDVNGEGISSFGGTWHVVKG